MRRHTQSASVRERASERSDPSKGEAETRHSIPLGYNVGHSRSGPCCNISVTRRSLTSSTITRVSRAYREATTFFDSITRTDVTLDRGFVENAVVSAVHRLGHDTRQGPAGHGCSGGAGSHVHWTSLSRYNVTRHRRVRLGKALLNAPATRRVLGVISGLGRVVPHQREKVTVRAFLLLT